MNVKIIAKRVTSKDGKVFHNYFIVTDNGVYIAFKPTFDDGYSKLRVLAEIVNDESK